VYNNVNHIHSLSFRSSLFKSIVSHSSPSKWVLIFQLYGIFYFQLMPSLKVTLPASDYVHDHTRCGDDAKQDEDRSSNPPGVVIILWHRPRRCQHLRKARICLSLHECTTQSPRARDPCDVVVKEQ
jgi:hypothetical protein